MSAELIVALRRAAAFDPAPLPEDLAGLHVPFDELLGERRVEQALGDAAELLREVGERRVLPSRTSQAHAGIGLQLPWLVKRELARDIRRELKPAVEVDRSAVEYLDALRGMTRRARPTTACGRRFRSSIPP